VEIGVPTIGIKTLGLFEYGLVVAGRPHVRSDELTGRNRHAGDLYILSGDPHTHAPNRLDSLLLLDEPTDPIRISRQLMP
jgi:hypothetical protein